MFRTVVALLLLATTFPAAAFPVERCINLGAAMEAPVEGEWGYIIQRRHITAIADAGFDTVRLPVRFLDHWDGTRLSPAILARTDEVIGWAEAEGLNTILDLHHFEGFATEPNVHTPTLIAIWQALSDHYVDAPESLMFELFNEPNGAFTTELALPLFQHLTRAIRKDHPDRWIIFGGGEWNDLDEMLALPAPDTRVMHTFHYYRPWTFTHQGAAYLDNPPPARDWGTSDNRATLSQDMTRASASADVVFLGEFGVYAGTDPAQRLSWITAVRREAEANGIPWCYWGFTQGDVTGFSAYDTATERWEPGLLDALFR